MKQEISPKQATRARAFELWMSSPMPMVTLVKTLDVTRLVKYSNKHGMSFNMLLCWCIGRAASQVKEFYTLPEHGRLYRYDRLAVNVIVASKEGGINSCDIPMDENLHQFSRDYSELTAKAAEQCQSVMLPEYMVVGTSAMIQTELDCIVNQYTSDWCNPMVMWGKYRKGLFKTSLPVSFQFHHVQMDGAHAAQFLELLQQTIKSV